VNIWDKDARYSKIIETMKNGKSFPNIPEWVAIEGILIELSNGLGDVLRGAPSLQDVENQVVELFWNTHQKINQSLGYAEKQDKASTVSHIKKQLLAPVEEVVPESMSASAEEQGGSIWVFILVVVIAAVAAVGGMALSMLIRKR
jgi:multiple sugar transport system substrate-binding protein